MILKNVCVVQLYMIIRKCTLYMIFRKYSIKYRMYLNKISDLLKEIRYYKKQKENLIHITLNKYIIKENNQVKNKK